MDDDARSRTLVFIGDSITDAGRLEDPDGLGSGYVRMVAAQLAEHAQPVRVINRGVSGDRAADLRVRFDRDCLALAPDVVTIYVGVNDTWQAMQREEPTTSAADFDRSCRSMLDSLASEHPAARVVLMLPFLVDVDEGIARGQDDLGDKAEILRRLARERGAAVVDLPAVMRRAEQSGLTPHEIAEDGVHPTDAGNRLLAAAWLEAYLMDGAHLADGPDASDPS